MKTITNFFAFSIFCLLIFITGFFFGSLWQKSDNNYRCNVAWNYITNDSDVWIDINNNQQCYDKIDCDIMYDREKGWHTYINLNNIELSDRGK
jgi:hypothetical protein